MGCTVGEEEGLPLGSDLGKNVGVPVGLPDGLLDGEEDGSWFSVELSLRAYNGKKLLDGSLLGDPVGSFAGPKLLDSKGDSDGPKQNKKILIFKPPVAFLPQTIVCTECFFIS